jgi:uncharacterized protein YjbI with pentapeptide repeats
MCPAVSPLKTHKSKPTKTPSTGRDAPDISPDLPRLAAAAELFRSPEIVVRDCMIENLTLEDFSTQSILFENCALHRLNLTRSKFGGLRLRDVRMVECDFANSEALTSKMLRVEFLNCRLTGFRATEAECQHVLISGGDAAFSQFRFGVFKTCEFISCNLSESDFHHSDLRGAILKGCDFKNAEMAGAKLEGADFRGSRVEGLVANPENFKGAIVDPAQAMVFAELMGLKIR